MVKIPALLLMLVISLSACSSKLMEQPDLPAPKVPHGCVTLYRHTYGDHAEQDKYAGVYCKEDDLTLTPNGDQK